MTDVLGENPHVIPLAETQDKNIVDPPRPVFRQRPALRTAMLMTAFALILGVHVWSLRRYPAPSVDEAWLIARAWRFLHTGQPFGQLDVGILDRTPNEWRTIGYVGPTLQALGMLAVDQPGLIGP